MCSDWHRTLAMGPSGGCSICPNGKEATPRNQCQTSTQKKSYKTVLIFQQKPQIQICIWNVQIILKLWKPKKTQVWTEFNSRTHTSISDHRITIWMNSFPFGKTSFPSTSPHSTAIASSSFYDVPSLCLFQAEDIKWVALPWICLATA